MQKGKRYMNTVQQPQKRQGRPLGSKNTPKPVLALPEGLITKDEVARRLRKSPRTVEVWQRRGWIPVIKAGHSRLYKWEDVEERLKAISGPEN